MSLGCDYASVDGNKPPSFGEAYAYGLRFAIIRGAYVDGAHVYVDSTLARDRGPAHAAGLIVGTYLILGYDQSGPTPEEQANALIVAWGETGPNELPVAIDAETNSPDHSSSTDAERLAWVQRAYDVLHAKYGVVMTYTSENQWSENFGDGPSEIGNGPLWIKVAYPWNPDNPPHPTDIPPVGVLPVPWRASGSPGAWILQFQGDAKGVPGFSSTVDLDTFLYYTASSTDTRTPWVVSQLIAAGELAGFTTDPAIIGPAIGAFQTKNGLTADETIGPATLCVICRT